MKTITSFWADRLLGPSGSRRVRAGHSLLALAAYLLFALCQLVAVALGLMPLRASLAWMAFYLAGGSILFLLIRSGASERWGCDPSLTVPQTLFGLLAAIGAYTLAGPVRGAVIGVAMLVVLFGAFKLTPRQGQVIALGGFLSLALLMGLLAWLGVPGHAPREELVLLAISAVTGAMMAVLVVRLSQLRQRLLRQRADLADALERIRQLARRDELTGLPNRRTVLEALQAAAQRQARGGEPVALVMIDLDHFKAINDQHGHRAGDLVLQGFAQRAGAILRAVDELGRWGGEEFLLVLPDTSLAQAQACIERLREHLHANPFDHVAPGLTLNFSAGLTACRGPADQDEALERADRALYAAKAAGRGCTESL